MLKVFLISILIIVSCNSSKHIKTPVKIKNHSLKKQNTVSYKELYAKYPDCFIGIGYAEGFKKKLSLEKAKMNALSDITNSIKISINGIIERLKIEKNNIQYLDEFKQTLLSVSEVQIRDVKYKIIRETITPNNKYDVTILAYKKRTEYFNDYIYLNSIISEKKFNELFENYYKLIDIKNSKIE